MIGLLMLQCNNCRGIHTELEYNYTGAAAASAAAAAAAAAVLGGSVVGGSVVGLHFLSCLLGGDTLSFLLPLYTFIVVALHVHSCGPISEKT